ncbi:Probable L-gulonolactone oxidase 6 [Linum perenne]
MANQLAIPTILIITITVFISSANSSPPENPVKCRSHNTDCTISNSYGNFSDRAICRAAAVVYPSSQAELIAIVANATKMKQKMKVTTRYSHSMTKLVCPDGDSGLLISTNNLNRIVKIDNASKTVTVESGVLTGDLYDALARSDLALPYAPYYRGLTIGGLISTHADGSTLKKYGGSPSDLVVRLTIVSPGTEEQGYVRVRKLDGGGVGLDAARITLRVEPLFKRSISFHVRNDTDFAHRAEYYGWQHEFPDITWYPYQRKAVYRLDDRVGKFVPGNGTYDFFPMRRALSSASIASRATEEKIEANEDNERRCALAKEVLPLFYNSAYGFTNDGKNFTRYPITGYHNKLQATGSCFLSPEDNMKTSCSWDPRINGAFFHQTTFAMSLPLVNAFIHDVQRLVAKNPKAVCMLDEENGILVRYHRASTAFLGRSDDSVGFDFSYYRSRDPLVPRLYEDAIEEIEQMALFKYNATPHWGKNRHVAFEGAIKKYKNGHKFLKVKEEFDPLGLFSSEWTDYLLGLREGPTKLEKGCALDGMCVCRSDEHCSPEKGYFCRPGKVYKDARVCRKTR